MFNISQFKQNVSIVRPNLFVAEIVLPYNLDSGLGPTLSGLDYSTSKFKFRCEATELPGKTIATLDDIAYGPTTKFAYDVTYNDITLQIIASEDMAERKMFEKWMDSIVTPTNGNSNQFKGGLIKYYDTYATGALRIRQLNDQGTDLLSCTLYNAYPIQISPMNVTWEETNTYQRFSVTMTYRFHIYE